MSNPTPTVSALIPCFDWDPTRAVRALWGEIAREGLTTAVDIVIADDGSQPVYAEAMQSAVQECQAHGVRATLIVAPQNRGRSATRNSLIEHAIGDFLLFLDADVVPDSGRFVSTYLNALKSGNQVLCGGVSYEQCGKVEGSTRFYHAYSSVASVAPADKRQRDPWAWIFTANMMVSREAVSCTPFDDGFVGYGYEDLEWGLRLHQAFGVAHIDNPVTHLGLLTKATLSRKMRESAPNLVHLVRLHPQEGARLALVRWARSVARLPQPVLKLLASVSSAMFHSDWLGFQVNRLGFQFDKLLSAALAFRSDNERKD